MRISAMYIPKKPISCELYRGDISVTVFSLTRLFNAACIANRAYIFQQEREVNQAALW
jgi:hypothetical protein